MEPQGAKTHLIEAFRWSKEQKTDWVEILGATIGMAAPVMLGVAIGNLPLGLAISVGGLLIGGAGANRDWRSQLRELSIAFVPAAMASVVAVAAAGHGWWSDALVVMLASIAAVVAAMGRPVAVVAMRFILYLIITIAVAESVADRAGLLLLMAIGALWTSFVCLALGAIGRKRGGYGASVEAAPPPLTARQRIARWRRSLTHLAAWQYAIRLTLCLCIAAVLKGLWPDHHLHWVMLTVALLIEWQIDAFPVRTTQRAFGAAFGVLATGLLIIYMPPAWALVACVGLLAGARPLLRVRNYLAYSAAMTPLIILVLDLGQPPNGGILIDRLLATLIGAALVIGANLIVGKLIRKST